MIWPQPSQAEFDIECYIKGNCNHSGGGGSSSSSPSTSNQIRLNPAAVPTEKGFGVESLVYSTPEWSIVQGLGRAGAAISPANSEETFFGPPAIEYNTDYLQRHIDRVKYSSQKYTLATAVKLVDKWGSGLTQFNLNLGALAKYNKYTTRVTPGIGITGALGPIMFGTSYYLDETQLDPQLDVSLRPAPTRYKVQTYNVGLYLSSIVMNYSNLQMTDESGNGSTVSVLTASLLVKRFNFNIAARSENSARSWYNSTTNALETKQIKEDYFAGVQVGLTKYFMLGSFYNYYLLHEFSATGTLFF